MIKDIIISVERSTRMVYLSKYSLGNDSESMQANLVFKFKDEFVDGTARLEYSIAGEKGYVMLQKGEDNYSIPVINALTKEGQNDLQLVITEGTDENAIPIFKSNIFYIYVGESINHCPEQPEEYPQWIDVANTKLNQIDEAIEKAENLDVEVEKVENTATITITKQDGSQKEVQIFDGEQGEKGEPGEKGDDALVNGMNVLNIVGGLNVEVEQIGSNLIINSESGYDDTEIRQEINNLDIEVDGLTNNINEIVRTKADKTEIPDVSSFVTKAVDDLANYYLKTETYTKGEVNQLIGAIKTISMKVVPERPTVGETNVIYLVPSAKSETENIYDEYIYVNNAWELIGSTSIDLSNYYTKDEINTLLFDYITSNDLEEALENYAFKTYVDEEVKKLDDRIDEIELFKFPNVIIHGEPVINNGQVSGFTRENYLSLPAVFNLHDRGFEFNFAVRTNSDVTTAQNILGSRFCMALLVENSKLKLKVSSNGESWDLVDIESNVNIQANTIYYIQIYFDKLTYKLRYSLDGIEYTDIASKVASVSPHPAQIYLGVGNNFFNPFNGIINLNKCNLKVNNSIVWQGMDDAGLATRMATDMENIDEAGIEKIKEIAQEIIPDTTNFLNKNYTGTNELKGRVQIGDKDSNITNAINHIRNVGTSSITGKAVNGACYSVNSDGTASLQHKTYNDDGTGAKNTAVLRFSNAGIEFAINTGTGASPTEDMYKELATQEYVNNLVGNIDTLLQDLDTGRGVE